MIRALLLIVDSSNTWDRIEKSQQGLLRVFVLSVLPVLLISSAIEGYGLIKFGHERGGFVRKTRLVPRELAARYEVFSFAANLILLFGGAWLLKMIGEGFHRRHSYREAFVTTAYSLSLLFLCRAFNAIPALSPWITWGAGIFLALGAMYGGIPRLMRPDPSNALGLYIITSIVFIIASGLITYLGVLVLDEQILSGLKIMVQSSGFAVKLG